MSLQWKKHTQGGQNYLESGKCIFTQVLNERQYLQHGNVLRTGMHGENKSLKIYYLTTKIT